MRRTSEEGHIVNTSSINGFWASVCPRVRAGIAVIAFEVVIEKIRRRPTLGPVRPWLFPNQKR
jgi:hypothetical protein